MKNEVTADEFRKAVTEALVSMSEDGLSDTFGVSLDTVRGWAAGSVVPYSIVRGTVLTKLYKLKEERK